mgnify:FL=1
MGSIYIAIILLCRVAQNTFYKRASNMVTNNVVFMHYSGFRQILSALLGLLMIVIAGNGFKNVLPTAVIATISGIMLVGSMYCDIFAMQSGTVALTSLFGTAGIIVPCVAGVFLFGQPIRGLQWLGLLLFFVSAYLMITSSKKVFGTFTLKTFFLLVGSLLFNGFVMLTQQMFTAYIKGGDVSVFSFFMFGISGILLLVSTPLMSKVSGDKVEKLPKKLVLYGIVLAAAVFIINQLATLATGFVPPIILFTFINGGGMVIAAVVAAVMFNEKLTFQSTAGIVLGVISMIMIKLFA